jgi:5-methylthioadenosine/S-adenosylhomocysteine deaminase
MIKVDLILTGGTVVTMNTTFDVYAPGAVAVKGDSIVAVNSAESILADYTADETVDCSGQVIIPGLVNTHTHVPMTLLRGLNDDLRLDVWLGYLMPVERQFVTPEFVRLGTRLACAEMIRSGITSFADMYYFEDDIADETAQAGMRALLGQTILMFPAPDAASYEDALVNCRRFIEKWNGHTLIQPAVAPHAWYTNTPELLRACADLARAFDVPLHTHISETSREARDSQEQNHMNVVAWNEKNGILNTKLLAAHCVHVERSEILMLKDSNAGVAHNPTSNLKLSSGIAPIAEMLEAGVNVGIGTDGPASNNDLDMFEELRLAALLGKVKRNDPTDLPARQAFELATIGGARAMHMGDVTGSLEPGKRADLAILDMNGIHNWPHFHGNTEAIYSRLVYATKSTDVVHVVCDGQWLMRDRALLTVDEATAQADAAEVARQIDAFVAERESSPFNKLVILEGVQRQESYEVQVKVKLDSISQIVDVIDNNPAVEITKSTRYRQFDHYFIFDRDDPDAARLRHREDAFVDDAGKSFLTRSRLTLLGQAAEEEYDNAVMLSRSRWLAPATHSLRFYREYFDPEREVEVSKERRRWRILFEDTEFAINLDQLIEPATTGYFMEVKARTWSRTDAERKAAMIADLLILFDVAPDSAERREYVTITSDVEDA